MKPELDSHDRDFLERLHRLEGGAVQDLCAALGVTATAVRQRLQRLLEWGYVCRETIRAGRGRPHHSYRLTEAGRRELGENYSDLAMILWKELKGIEEPEIRGRVMSRVREALVTSYGAPVRSGSLNERMRELSGALADRGFDMECDTEKLLPVLRENNCPYLELAASDRSICELEQSVFGAILGAEVSLTQCCLDGHACCEFRPTVCHDTTA